MRGAYSAACRPARATVSSATVARSMKPGLPGENGKNAYGGRMEVGGQRH